MQTCDLILSESFKYPLIIIFVDTTKLGDGFVQTKLPIPKGQITSRSYSEMCEQFTEVDIMFFFSFL